MMKKIVLFLVFLFSIIAFAQEKFKIRGGLESNSQWYLNDKKTGDFAYENPFRSNNYIFLTSNYKNWQAGLQAEAYQPDALLNYNPGYKGTKVATYYLQYKNKKIDLVAGYFYEQFGSGLILRSWEDRTLGINNALRGGKIVFRPSESINLTGLYGKQRSGFTVANSTIFGFDTDISLNQLFNIESNDLTVGCSYVGRDEITEVENPIFPSRTDAFSGRINYSNKSYYFSSEYDYKSKDAIVEANSLQESFIKPGNAFLLNIGYSEKGLGIDATFRRLENMSFFSERKAKGNQYNDRIMNFIPALTKQHHSSLSNIYVYQAQPSVSMPDYTLLKAGEIGGQIDFFYNFKKETALGGKYGTKVAFNTSNWFNLDGDFSIVNPRDYNTKIIGFGQKYFSDYNFEIIKKWNNKWASNISYINQYYNKKMIEETYGVVKTNIVAADATYKLNTKKSVRLELEHLWADTDKKNWMAGTLEYFHNSKFSFYCSNVYNYGNDDFEKRIHYYNIGGSYNKGASRLQLNYGRQRGGLVCVGGVCRQLPESTGVSISLSTSF